MFRAKASESVAFHALVKIVQLEGLLHNKDYPGRNSRSLSGDVICTCCWGFFSLEANPL